MAEFNTIFWLNILALLASINFGASAKVFFNNCSSHQALFPHRTRRQTHPAATIAKLTPQDSSAFIPIVGPTQSQSSQQHTSFTSSSNDFFPGNEFPNLHNVPNTLVDYLVPPSPDSPTSTLNFQDPAANLHSLQNNIDNFEITSSPTPSPNTNSNNFPHFHGSFQGGSNFQNHINNLQHLQTTPSTFINEQIQSVAFQNPPSVASATPSLTQPGSSLSPPLGGIGQTFSNKISNTGTLNRDGFTPINNGNHFHTSQFSITTSAPSLPSLTKTDHDKTHQSPSNGKWELGFDANEILSPPREDSFGRVGEYDTINVNKFRRPSTNLNPPVPNNEVQSNQNHLSSNQFSISNNGAHQFNQFSSSTSGSSHNDLFTPVNSNPNHFTPNKENNIEQGNVVWGSQKQPVSYNPTTSAPFLPTIPPSSQTQHLSNFQNINQPPSVSQNFLSNGFNSASQQLQQLQFTQPPPPPKEQYFEFNQNFPIDSPLTSQFDTFLPQGTVADHTYQPYNENGRHFVRKRQWDWEDRVEPLGSQKRSLNDGNQSEKNIQVVTSRGPTLIKQIWKAHQEGSQNIRGKKPWNGEDNFSSVKDSELIEQKRKIIQEGGQHIRKKRHWDGKDNSTPIRIKLIQLHNKKRLSEHAISEPMQKNKESHLHTLNRRHTTHHIRGKNEGEKGKGGEEEEEEVEVEEEEKEKEREENILSIFKRHLTNKNIEEPGNDQYAKRKQWNGEDEAEGHEEDEESQSNYNSSPFGVKRPVYSFVKTDRDGHFKWSVRHPSKR